MVRGDQQTEGTRGKGQGSLQAPTAALLTDKFLLRIGVKKLSAPPFLKLKRGGQEEAAAAPGEKPVKEPLSKSPPEKDQVSLTTFQATVIAHKTKHLVPAWQEITADKQILRMIQGCPIEFKSMPTNFPVPIHFHITLLSEKL